MKINYIVGRSQTGKSYELMTRIRADIEEDKLDRIILIVPEQYTLHAEYELINKMDLKGLIKLEVLSFKRLAYRVLEKTPYRDISIKDVGKYMMLNKIINKHRDDLKILKNPSQKGVLSEILSIINNFKRNNIYGIEIAERLASIEGESVFKSKLEDLALIYEKLEDEITSNYLDDSDILDYLAENIADSDFLKNTKIYLDGFDSFSRQEYGILEKLMLRVNSIDMVLTLSDHDRDSDVFATPRDTLNRLRAIAKDYGIEEGLSVKGESVKRDPELAFLEGEFYSYPYHRFMEKTEKVKIRAGLNRNVEVETIAKDIIGLVRDEGYRWKDILIVSNNMNIYQSIFKRVFSEHEIPYFLDETRDITNEGLIRYVLSSLEAVSKNFRYDDVFKALKTGFSNLTQGQVEQLENYALEHDIRGNRWFSPFEYGHNAEELEAIRHKYMEPMARLRESVKKKTSVNNINIAIFDFLSEVGAKSKMDTLLSEQKYHKRFDKANESAQVWNMLMDVLTQIDNILGREKMSLKDYLDNIESGLSNYEIGVIPPTLDQVIIGNLERSRTKDVRALFLVGVNDGILPSIVSDSGILTDQDKINISELGLDIRMDSDKKIQDERFLIYSCISKPSEKLVFSYALSDHEGKSLRPSTIIERLRELYDNISEEHRLGRDSGMDRITLPRPSMKYLVEGIRDYVELDVEDEVLLELLAWYKARDEYRGQVESIIEGVFYTNQQDYLKGEYAKLMYSKPFKSSISRLERFIKCPFSHFVNYGIKPNERKKCEIKIPDIGNVFHKSIEEYSKELEGQGLDWRSIDKERSEVIVDGVIDRMVEEFQSGVFSKSNRYKYLVKKLKRVSKKAIWTATEHIRSGEFEPLKHEISFGEKDCDIPPLIIQLPNGEEIILEGRIDRVDMLELGEKAYVKVIDYKSGSKTFSLSDIFYGLQIQLIVYLEAIMQNKDKLVKSELYPAGAFYFKIKDPMIRIDTNDSEAIEEAILKELKLDGIAIKDVDIIKLMDKNIESGGNSKIIPAGINNKDGEFNKKTSSVYDSQEFEMIADHVRGIIRSIGQEILKGKVKIEPCKSGDLVSCEYCEFDSICQFDIAFEGNEYNKLSKLSNKEVVKRMYEEGKGGSKDDVDKGSN